MNSLEDKIKTLAKKCGTEIKLEKFLKNDNAFSESIQHVEKNIYSEEVVPQKSDGSVTIFECEDITDECLTVDGIKEIMLDHFHNTMPNRECNRIVFFFSRKNVERDYKEEGLDVMRGLDDVIIYEKGELANVIKNFVDNN
jgi:hypothetical protein